jgi:hypothetical protein
VGIKTLVKMIDLGKIAEYEKSELKISPKLQLCVHQEHQCCSDLQNKIDIEFRVTSPTEGD